MFCRNWIRVLQRGMAAFLLLFLMAFLIGSGAAFASETENVAETGKTGEGESEIITTVNLEGKDQAGDEAVEEIAKEDEVLLFSQSEPVDDKTVVLYYNRTIKYESYATHDFHVECDGKKILAYCIEPATRWGGEKKYKAEPYDDSLMRKVLYYCYGNPGYGKLKDYLSGVSRKSCYKGNDGAYALCHILLSYVYDGESTKGDAFKGCSSETKKLVKKIMGEIRSWPDPPGESELGLSSETVKADWSEKEDIQITPDIKVTGTEGNSIEVPVPEGTTLVCGDESVSGGSRTVTVGESFHFTAPDTVRGTYQSPLLASSMKNFQPYIISSKSKQDEIFSISTASQVSFSVKWEEFGEVVLKKSSADESVTSGKDDYSLEGARYELYGKETGKSFGTFVTDENGEASLDNIPYGEYYTKETGAPKGYELDKSSHGITVASETTNVAVSDKPESVDPGKQEDEKETDDMPKTGDEFMLLLLLAGIGVSIMFGALAIVTKN